jgi:hypothetical protein
LIQLEGEIQNNGAQTVYFMSESCNDMLDLFITDSSRIEVIPILFCEISEPVKRKIKSGSSYKFTATLKPKKIGMDYQIDLKFEEYLRDEHLKMTVLAGKLIQNK